MIVATYYVSSTKERKVIKATMSGKEKVNVPKSSATQTSHSHNVGKASPPKASASTPSTTQTGHSHSVGKASPAKVNVPIASTTQTHQTHNVGVKKT